MTIIPLNYTQSITDIINIVIRDDQFKYMILHNFATQHQKSRR